MAYYSLIETILWLSSPALQVFLLIWAVRKKLFGTFPVFFWYLTFALAKTAVLYPMRRVASIYYYYYSPSIGMSVWKAYFVSYWCGEVTQTVLFIIILYELYTSLFRGYAGFRALQDKLFQWSAGTSLAVSVIAAVITPVNDHTSVMTAVLTFNLTAAVVKAGMVFFILIVSSILGLRWGYYAFGILAGTGLFATVEAASVAMGLYTGDTIQPEWTLIKSGAYVCAMMIWVIFYTRQPKMVSGHVVPDNDLASWNQALVEMLTR